MKWFIISSLFLVGCSQNPNTCDTLVNGYLHTQSDLDYTLVNKNKTSRGYHYDYGRLDERKFVSRIFECNIEKQGYTLHENHEVVSAVIIPHLK
ncbi:hypothetical protein [Acinetobacter sp. HY1485]|uniref:hypothetical protein n=1 Tax=Acinetobacter sp. HY1485 TaxID=2970918 RepID=UPI0022B9C14A|nr:hypothetical protein [Acinetobacter sp. HY1485]